MADSQFFDRHPVDVAIDLVGCTLISTRDGVMTGGRIVETEAYAGPHDAASHSARMAFARQVMSGPVGRIYVYRSYGIHLCFNIVSHLHGEDGAVLIRAIEPTIGIDAMRLRRGVVSDRQLARGPGNVGAALGVSLRDNGEVVGRHGVNTVIPLSGQPVVMGSARIGISKATDAQWRFFDPDSPAVSAHRRGTPIAELNREALRKAVDSVE